MLPKVKSGQLLCKYVHNAPPLDDINSHFGEEYNEAKRGVHLNDDLNIAHLTKFQRAILTALVQKYYHVFSKKGVTCPVKNYECEIDTGTVRPIACKNPTIVPLKMPIIEQTIAKLVKLGHVKQIHEGEWLSKPLLAPKPHQ